MYQSVQIKISLILELNLKLVTKYGKYHKINKLFKLITDRLTNKLISQTN